MVTSKSGERDHDFTLLLHGLSEAGTAVEDALFEAGCDDATVVTRDGQVFLDFTRTAATYRQAVECAVRDVRAAGFDAGELAAVSPPPAS